MSITIKSSEVIANDILISILDNVPSITDANVGSILRQHAEAIADEIELLYDNLQSIFAGTRISTSTAGDLDELGRLVGKTRNGGLVASDLGTFQRNTAAPTNFNINENIRVSTQPNTGEEQLQFIVSSTVTFLSTIADEGHFLIDGNWNYRLNERFVDDTTNTVITGFATSTSLVYTFVNPTDFSIISFNDFVVKTHTITDVDDAENTSGWNGSVDAIPIATTSDNFKEGSLSLALGKDGTSSTLASYEKTLGSAVDGTAKYFVIWLRTASTAIRDLLTNFEITIGSGGSASNSFKKVISTLVTAEWARYRFLSTEAGLTITGNPDITNINFIKVAFNTGNTTDLVSSGDINMDYLIFADTESFEGDVVEWQETTSPLTETTFEVDYTPLSKEVPLSSAEVGSKFNVNKNKITTKVSNIPNIDSVNNYIAFGNGVDIEVDASFRTRIQTAAESQGTATVAAIQQAVLDVTSIISVLIDDLPRIIQTGEVHTFSTGNLNYPLDREVVFHDAEPPTNITIVGTVSASSGHTFAYGTDFISSRDSNGVLESNIEWQSGGTNPDDGTEFVDSYTYDWLGHVFVHAATAEGALTDALLDQATTAVELIKAAGVQVSVFSATKITVNVTATVLPTTGFTFAGIQTDIETALIDFINNLNVGDEVYLAAMTEVAMGVDGIENFTISVPAADTTIAITEVARAGTISLSAE